MTILGQTTALPATNATGLISINEAGTATGNNSAMIPSISADGRYVIFQSAASNLVANDLNGAFMDVFVRDRRLGTTQFVSVNRLGTGSGNQMSGSFDTTQPAYAITPNGRYVVFQSRSTDLVATNDFNSAFDLYVRDLQAETTTLVSVNSAGTAAGNGMSFLPVITPDGRYVAFQSSATDMVPGGSPGGVFVRDMQTGTTILVNVNNSGVIGTGSIKPDMSNDGRIVAFQSTATNLAPNDTNGGFDIFVRDLQVGTTSLVSINASGTASGNTPSGGLPPCHVVSADGRYVLFESSASDLTTTPDLNGANDLFMRDLQTNTTKLISVNLSGVAGGAAISTGLRPGISADGHYVVFTSFASDLVAGDNNNSADVFIRDVQLGVTSLVSVNSAGTGSANNFSLVPTITPNGRYVGFVSSASNLTANDTNGLQDSFVRDMQTGVTTLLNVSSGGATIGNGDSNRGTPCLTPDGRYVAFQSVATNLVPTPDTNEQADIFIYTAAPQFGALQFELTGFSVNENGGAATITVTRTGGTDGPVSVNYATSDGTATAGTDYAQTFGTLAFPDGASTESFTIPITNDALDEADETINLILSTPAGGAILGSSQTAVLTIHDDEPLVSISDASITEGNNGAATATVTVSLSLPSSFPVTVNYTTLDGTAIAPSDYQAASSTLTFNPGETSHAINVTINGDTLVEPNETFFINLTNPTTASIADGQAVVTINNDDIGGTLQFTAVGHLISEGGNSALITVTRTGGNASGVSVQYMTSDGTATGGQDYVSTSGTLSFGADETVKSFTIPILDDALVEGNEMLNLLLTSPAGGAMLGSTAAATLTIVDNDTAQSHPVADFDGDRRSDLAVFRPSNGSWYLLQSSNGAFVAQPFGTSGDLIAPGDFSGDGRADYAVFRPSTGYWYILEGGSFRYFPFGQSGDIPATGDYDRDGKADIAVYRPSASTFYVSYSSDNSFHYQQWGTSGDVPVIGDYDGDGRSDFAIFRPSSGTFYILRSSDGGVIGQQFGTNGDKPIAADFDGDGKTDIAVYRPSTSAWYSLNSSDNSFRGISWGTSGDIPAGGDYDGDGKWDVAVFRPSSGTFYILQSTSSTLRADQFGANGDVPVPSAYVP